MRIPAVEEDLRGVLRKNALSAFRCCLPFDEILTCGKIFVYFLSIFSENFTRNQIQIVLNIQEKIFVIHHINKHFVRGNVATLKCSQGVAFHADRC